MVKADIKIPWAGWTINKELGKGQFGKVYEIERQLLNSTEKAAMKVISIPKDEEALELMRLAYGYDDSAVARSIVTQLTSVEGEYSIMTKMRGHSNIVSCDDFSYVPHEGRPGYDVFIRMELLKSLQTVIREKRNNGQSFSEDEVLKIGADICRALKVCEGYNLIHRDIKPQNIMISPTGDYKLGDFGEARSMDHTTQASFAGTQSFMAPEVFKYEKYGKTVDIYSLGLVMHWLLNRYRRPFIPHDVPATPDMMAASENRRLSGEALEAPCDASPELSKVILKACAYKSEDRYRNADEMLNALKGIIAKKAKKAKDAEDEPVVVSPSPEDGKAVSASSAQIRELEPADTVSASAHLKISELEDAKNVPASAPAHISEPEDADDVPASTPAQISEPEDAGTLSIPYPHEVNDNHGPEAAAAESDHIAFKNKEDIENEPTLPLPGFAFEYSVDSANSAVRGSGSVKPDSTDKSKKRSKADLNRAIIAFQKTIVVGLVVLIAIPLVMRCYEAYSHRHDLDRYYDLHSGELEEIAERIGIDSKDLWVGVSSVDVSYDIAADGISPEGDVTDDVYNELVAKYTTDEMVEKMSSICTDIQNDTGNDSAYIYMSIGSHDYGYLENTVFCIYYYADGSYKVFDRRDS